MTESANASHIRLAAAQNGIDLWRNNNGALRQVDADTVLDMIVGAAMQALSLRNVTDLDEYATSLTDVLLRGVLGHESGQPA